jgi:hypothetical protein
MNCVFPENSDGCIQRGYCKLFFRCSPLILTLKGALNITQTAGTSEQSTLRKVGFVEKHKYRLALVAFLIVFAAFSLYNVGYMSVQWDEMPHLNGGLLLMRGQTWDYMTTFGYYPPLFDLMTTGYFQVFGVNEGGTTGRGNLLCVRFGCYSSSPNERTGKEMR